MQSRQLISLQSAKKLIWERLRQLIQGRKLLRGTGLQLYFRLSEKATTMTLTHNGTRRADTKLCPSLNLSIVMGGHMLL